MWEKAAIGITRLLQRLQGRIKIITSYYQVASSVSRSYQVLLPTSSAAVLDSAALLNLDLAGLGLPLACVGMHRIEQRLLFSLVAPVLFLLLANGLLALREQQQGE